MEREECGKQCLCPGTSQGIVSSKDRAVYLLDLALVLAGCDCSMNHARGKEGRRKTRGVVVLGPQLPLKIN